MLYGVSTKVDTGFDETIARVTQALKEQGLGILSPIRRVNTA
ncbi:MAG: hypothetical protein ACLFNA_10440 [Halochromatium sp.]